MITIEQSKKVFSKITLSEDEIREVIRQYIMDVVIGTACYITSEGDLEHWTSYPHGSGTTTKLAEATKLQILAKEFLKELIAQNE